MENLVINQDGTVRFNGEKLGYDSLCENFEKVGQIKTDSSEIDLFKTEEGILEYLADGTFASGEDVNFTTLSIEELEDYYS